MENETIIVLEKIEETTRTREVIAGCSCWYDNGDFEFDMDCSVHFKKEELNGTLSLQV
jgi:hypothetical protein